MELAVLNDQFQPARLVEGHSSLIWTERFSTAGDFTRESSDIGGTLSQLPITNPDGSPRDTFVTLRDSDVVMVVENHKIEKSMTGGPKIVTTGRSAETVLDRRTTVNAIGSKPAAWTVNAVDAVDAAHKVIQQILSQPLDAIPEILLKAPVRPSGWVTPPAKDFAVERGELYSWVLGQLQTLKYGFRAIRPIDISDNQFTLEIYPGSDKTDEVVFDVRFNQFDSSTYLLSNASWKNTYQVDATNDSAEGTDGGSYTGLQRRVAYLDATQGTAGLSAGETLDTAMANLGLVELAKNPKTVLFDGEISRDEMMGYGNRYSLGDIVKLTGDYGLSQFVRVSEFIRSVDSGGEKAYPTFEALRDETNA